MAKRKFKNIDKNSDQNRQISKWNKYKNLANKYSQIGW